MSRANKDAAVPARTVLLLPARSAFAGRVLPRAVARALGCAEVAHGDAGEAAQLQRHFELAPRGWPVAALTRAVDTDAADAGGAQWLRADPAWIRPDINGARLFAAGEGLRLSRADADALLPALRPLFGDIGMPIDAPDPSRWYLRIAPGTALPAFADPADALGSDLGDALVDENGLEARRWRTLLSEAQVALHNHPWNARRAAEGKPPVNSLWFWGGGALPSTVACAVPTVRTNDALMTGLAARAGVAVDPPAPRFGADEAAALHDLRDASDPDALVRDWLEPAMAAHSAWPLILDFADGACFRLDVPQRWRLWRKPLARLA